MSYKFWNGFAKITGWPIQKLLFRTKILYEDPAVQKRRIRGPAIVISNHTSVFDYVIHLFVFFSRTVRFQMAELLFDKKPLGTLLRLLGGIKVDRTAKDFSFLDESLQILEKGGVVGIFPESRLPRPGEERPLPFAPSAAFLAMTSGAPVIPIYTNGRYWTLHRAAVIVGTPMDPLALTDPALTEKGNIDRVAQAMRERIIELGNLLDGKYKEKEK